MPSSSTAATNRTLCCASTSCSRAVSTLPDAFAQWSTTSSCSKVCRSPISVVFSPVKLALVLLKVSIASCIAPGSEYRSARASAIALASRVIAAHIRGAASSAALGTAGSEGVGGRDATAAKRGTESPLAAAASSRRACCAARAACIRSSWETLELLAETTGRPLPVRRYLASAQAAHNERSATMSGCWDARSAKGSSDISGRLRLRRGHERRA